MEPEELMNRPKVSVIIPIYNTQKYLRQCLDSVLAQTLSEIEIICVDDGSTDDCPHILDEYAAKDGRVRVVHKENTGNGHSMNIGMDLAVGKYIGIVESDDKLVPWTFKTLYDAAERSGYPDFVKGECWFWWENIGYRYAYHAGALQPYFDHVLTSEHREFFYRFLMNIWTGIYRSDFIKNNNIRFHETEGASYQDNGFWMQVMSMADRGLCLGEPLYMYRQDNELSSVRSVEKVYAITGEYDYIDDILRGKGLWLEQLISSAVRLKRNKGTFLRVADEYKQGFLQQMISDYEKHKDGLLYDSDLRRWYSKFMQDPFKYCEASIKKRSDVRQKIERSNGVVIYGAGRRGEKALRCLAWMGFLDKVKCFVESKMPEKHSVGTIPVLNIDEAAEFIYGASVVISPTTGSRAYNDMKYVVDRKQANGVIDSDVVFDEFYWLC